MKRQRSRSRIESSFARSETASKWYHGRTLGILGFGGSRIRESSNGCIFVNYSQGRKVLLNKIIDRQMETNDLDETLRKLSDMRIAKPSDWDNDWLEKGLS